MRSLVVIKFFPIMGDLLHFIEIIENVAIKHLVTIVAVKSFNVSVLIRAVRLDVIDKNIMGSEFQYLLPH